MRLRGPTAALAAGTALLLATPTTMFATAEAATPRLAPSSATGSPLPDDTRHVPSDYFSRERLLDRQASKAALAQARRLAAAKVGDEKVWPASDYVEGTDYLKRFQLRGQGEHVQVWVANDRAFPTDDCRNDLGLTEITQRQVNAFVREFDKNILPAMSRSFSVAPNKNGRRSADLARSLDLPARYWTVGRNQADDTVVLLDNVRDENYFTPNTPEGQTFVGGFFSSQYVDLFDRNIMTVDVYDWLHRTGANPPDSSDDPDYQACAVEIGGTSMGNPRPRDYEGIFAHEYQHLLENYEDADEVNWVNEGLSDYAQTVTGYVNPKVPPASDAADSHIACFLGFGGRRFGGPENSLTLWEDQGGPEVLCDYGAAYTFMQYLQDHYGPQFLSALHRRDANGLRGLQAVLNQRADGTRAMAVVHRWQAMVALDQALDRNGGKLVGGAQKWFRAASLRSRIKWSNPEAYDEVGTPLNGADYVALRDADGALLPADEVTSIDFAGTAEFAPQPLEWVADGSPPDSTTGIECESTGSGTGPAALYSGCGNEMDRSIAREVTVPDVPNPTLSFDVLFQIEEGWDFGFVQLSADGGETWTSLETEDTTTEHDPAATASVVAQLPGYSGDSGGWATQTADLSDYAGEDVMIAFRYITDELEAEAGMWVRDVDVAGTTLPTGALTGWQTITQLNPYDVPGFTVQLVALGTAGSRVHRAVLPLDEAFEGGLAGPDVAAALGRRGLVAAIVTADDPSERFTSQAGYTLTVNGVEQEGGGTPGP